MPSLSQAYHFLHPRLGAVGAVLVIAQVICLVGALGAFTFGAAAAPIPMVGLMALPFLPFPTLALYLMVVLLVFLLVRLLPIPVVRDWIALAAGVAVALGLGFWIPAQANAQFDADLEAYQTRGEWRPVALPQGSEVNLVYSPYQYPSEKLCETFCLGLLLSGVADSVSVSVAPAFGQIENLRLSGIRMRLAPDADACLAQLPSVWNPRPYIPAGREDTQLREGFANGWLSQTFKDAIKKCLETEEFEDERMRGQVLVDWRNKFDPRSYERREVTLHARAAIVDARGTRPIVNEVYNIYGGRVASPLWIWPFGGNAGEGGRPVLSLATTKVPYDGPRTTSYQSDVPRIFPIKWWEYLADSDTVITAALARIPESSKRVPDDARR